MILGIHHFCRWEYSISWFACKNHQNHIVSLMFCLSWIFYLLDLLIAFWTILSVVQCFLNILSAGDLVYIIYINGCKWQMLVLCVDSIHADAGFQSPCWATLHTGLETLAWRLSSNLARQVVRSTQEVIQVSMVLVSRTLAVVFSPPPARHWGQQSNLQSLYRGRGTQCFSKHQAPRIFFYSAAETGSNFPIKSEHNVAAFWRWRVPQCTTSLTLTLFTLVVPCFAMWVQVTL